MHNIILLSDNFYQLNNGYKVLSFNCNQSKDCQYLNVNNGVITKYFLNN